MNDRRCLSRGIKFSAFGKICPLYLLFNYFQQREVIAPMGRGLLYLKKNVLFCCRNYGGEFNSSAGGRNGPEFED
jgi:predicted transcriptional regulator